MHALKFGRCEVRPDLRQVWVDGSVRALGTRAFDLLLLLITERHRVVPKDELLDRVWPGLVVEENNLTVQVSALRRALGAAAITTVAGRGYQFTSALLPAAPASQTILPAGNLPARSTRLFGREKELDVIFSNLETGGCVTVCGLAGIGKTALAGTAAQHLAGSGRYRDGVWLVSLADVLESDKLVTAVCEVIGIELSASGDPATDCLAHLQHLNLLLILDNCEHLIDAAATFVSQLLNGAGSVHVLCTSQEPLHVPGERILRLGTLSVPPSADATNATGYGAVLMLTEKVRAAMGGDFEPSSDELVDMVEICRQLDGIPLALEFASARVPLLGVAGVRSRLGDRLKLLAGGSRTAPVRHRSLQAALEWSHQLLSANTKALFHRLGVFPAGFSLLGAQLLLEPLTEADILEHLTVLVDRSLLTCVPGGVPRYRMLETTRAFALDCLNADNAGVDWQASHAQVICKLCLVAARQRDGSWMWQEMPNARAALSWAMEKPEHAEAAITIATYTSVVLAAGGSIREALDNLLQVQCRLDERTPAALVARYWHWLGRLGVEGRLPSSQCIEALHRADEMFTALGEPRHRHACQRHLAEAELRAGRLAAATAHLQAAREAETALSPPADRMRRLRVEALVAEASGDHSVALRHAQTALTAAETYGIDRYRLLLMSDMAWMHLQAGRADAAVTAFQDLLLHLDGSIRQGLARAHALSGLTAALIAAGRATEAARSATRSVRALQQVNLLLSRCDVLAWLAAAEGKHQLAAHLLGAADQFLARSEAERDPISTMAKARALQLVEGKLACDDILHWQSQGRLSSEAELDLLLMQAFGEPSGG